MFKFLWWSGSRIFILFYFFTILVDLCTRCYCVRTVILEFWQRCAHSVLLLPHSLFVVCKAFTQCRWKFLCIFSFLLLIFKPQFHLKKDKTVIMWVGSLFIFRYLNILMCHRMSHKGNDVSFDRTCIYRCIDRACIYRCIFSHT